ncbi:uncharacterized protein LOC102805608 [Saccoglossus kowalevskii]|uniref:E3 ubiquitin-protein ligase TRIM56-like n=1 Tax=Saccoglossus kowalevskii TaxID=10224 RepID=A0ABM0N166_SACKO|nr:PREDICTED: E3 ubiquitin-protein ligase TRIM56-like [Saccoglossus kowalevskii]
MASSFSSIKSQIKEDMLSCPMCFEVYNNPKVLQCLHCFCQRCLEGWARQNPGKPMSCPTCRFESPVNSLADIRALPTNFILNGLVDYIETMKEVKQFEGQCGGCGTGKAATRCIDCSQNLCQPCTSTHRNLKVTQQHKVVELGKYFRETEIPQPTVYCHNHEQSPVEVYCKVCQIPVCTKCALVEHRQHEQQYLEGATEEEKKRLDPQILLLKEYVVNNDQKATIITDELDVLREARDRAEKEIDDHTQKLISTILNKQEEMKKELGQVFTTNSEMMQSELKMLEESRSSLESAVEFAENMIKYASPAQYLKSQQEVKQRVTELIALEGNHNPEVLKYQMMYVPNNSYLRGTIGRINSIKQRQRITSVNRSRVAEFRQKKKILARAMQDLNKPQVATPAFGAPRPTSRERLVTVRKGFSGMQAKPCIEAKIGRVQHSDKLFYRPCGVAMNEKGDLVVADSDNCRVQILNLQTLTMKSSLAFDNFPTPFKPYDIAVLSDGRYFVTDSANNQVVVCNEFNQLILTFGHYERLQPRGIALTWDGHVLVTDVQHGASGVKKYTLDGTFVTCFGNTTFQGPSAVVVNSKQQVIVSDTQANRVCVMDVSGNLLHFLTATDGGKLECPSGVDVDVQDNTYVCDQGNNRIVKYNCKGQFVTNVGGALLKKPLGISITKDNIVKIAVTEINNETVKLLTL